MGIVLQAGHIDEDKRVPKAAPFPKFREWSPGFRGFMLNPGVAASNAVAAE